MKQISTRIIYTNRWMTLREDQIERPSGASGIYGVVDKPDFVLIIPYDGAGVYLVNQYRYAVSGNYWEFPQGSWEHAPDANPEELARGELREETGLAAQNMNYLGHLFTAYGFVNQGMHVFLATDLTAGEQQLDAEEEGLITKRFSMDEFAALIRNGQMKDNASMAAYALWTINGK